MLLGEEQTRCTEKATTVCLQVMDGEIDSSQEDGWIWLSTNQRQSFTVFDNEHLIMHDHGAHWVPAFCVIVSLTSSQCTGAANRKCLPARLPFFLFAPGTAFCSSSRTARGRVRCHRGAQSILFGCKAKTEETRVYFLFFWEGGVHT